MGKNRADDQNPLQVWTESFWRSVGVWPIGPQGEVTPPHKPDDPWLAMLEDLWRANPFSALLPLDAAQATRAYQDLWLATLRNPTRAWTNWLEWFENYNRLAETTALRAAGMGAEAEPVAVPEKGDRRFSAQDWQTNAIFDAVKQAYLLAAATMLKTASEAEGLDAAQQRKLIFYLRQYLDAMSPSNFALTNPEVIHEALRTGGQSLAKGYQNLLRDLQAGQISQTDMNAFAPGRNIAMTPGQVVYRNRLMELIQYTPQTEKVASLPLVFVPHWINRYYIMDLQPENSLIRYLVEQGFTVFVVSWKNPDASMEDIAFEDYMELGPLTAFRLVKEMTGQPQVNAVGYCIGGTLLGITLAYLAAIGDDSVKSATFFVSLLDFSEVGDTAVFVEPPHIAYVEAQMEQRGYLESREMATMFSLLRANDLIWSFVVNNYLLGKDPPPFDLLYWNADGTRMARAAHSFYLRNTYLENNLVKPGKVVMKGVPIDLSKVDRDIYAVGTELDHLVPWRTAWRISQVTSGKVRFVVGGSGHIAGVINPPTRGRGYWINDQPAGNAEEWFAGAQHHAGSWWSDWVDWLRQRSGKAIPPPAIGGGVYPPLAPAPGTYVLEK